MRAVDGRLEITDAGSTNGTFVNDERIEGPTELEHEDEIRLGRVVLVADVPPRSQPTVIARPVLPPLPPVLVFEEGELAGERVEVEEELVLGREDADLLLEDEEVSRRHASVKPVDGKLELADLGSSNGTFVNGSRIEGPQLLENGDEIRLGRVQLRVEFPLRSQPTVIARRDEVSAAPRSSGDG